MMRKNEKKHGFSLVVSKKCVPLHSLSGIQHLTSTEGRVL